MSKKDARTVEPAAETVDGFGVRALGVVARLGAKAHAGPLQATLDAAVRAVADTLGVEYAKILELTADRKEVFLIAGVGWKEGLVGRARVSIGLDSQAGYTLASVHPVVVDDLRAETRFSGPNLLHDHGVVSGLSVVIPGEDGRPWGVFGAHTRTRRRFGDEHVSFLQSVANVVAGAVARARTESTFLDARGALEREVAGRTRDLERAVEDLQAFNGMVAHDVRGPLRGVEQVARALREDYADRLDDEGRKLLASIHDSTVRMRQLVDALLTLARAGQDPLVMREVDVTALAHERWRELTADGAPRRVEFVVEEGLTAHADPRLLAVALDNLLGNALKFTRDVPRPVVEVGSRHLDVGGTAFYVRDNGAGFAPERGGELFHVFKRLHAPSDFEGTGLGLATVKRVVERHGGRAWAESEGRGKGATFFFRLLPAGLP